MALVSSSLEAKEELTEGNCGEARKDKVEVEL